MFRCKFLNCTSKFRDPIEFIDHMKLRHRLSEFKCVLCNDSFTSTYLYKRHLTNEFAKNQKIESENITLLEHLPFTIIQDEDPVDVELASHIPESIIVSTPFEEEQDFEQFSTCVFEMILDLYGNMGVTKKLASDLTIQVQNVICKPLLKNVLSLMKCEEDKKCLEENLRNIGAILEEMNSEHRFKNLLKRNNLYFEAVPFTIAGQIADSKGYLFPLKNNIETLFTSKPDLLIDMLITYNELIADEDSEIIRSLVNGDVWKEKAKRFEGKIKCFL